MPKKSQCEIHSEELNSLRINSHDNTNKITTLQFMHEANCQDIGEIKGDINTIKTNHLSHIETDISQIKTNLEWLMKTYWIVATCAIGGLISGVITIIINYK